MKFIIYSGILLLNGLGLIAQLKNPTLEDIVEKGVFRTKGLSGFEFSTDGRTYTNFESNKINRYLIETGDFEEVVFDVESKSPELLNKIQSYEFSKSGKLILFTVNSESIYRYSTIAQHYVFNFESKKLIRIFNLEYIMYPSISPDDKYIAFVYQNNLYCQNLESGKIKQITNDGNKGQIINGASDWIYEEEFTLTRAYEWSPYSDQIAFLKFDESNVKEFSMEYYKDQPYPEVYKFKYPKVGEENSSLSVWIYNLNKKKPQILNTGIGSKDNVYIPRINWTHTENQLCVTTINRTQNNLKLILVNTNVNTFRVLLDEKNNYYIELHDNLVFSKDGKYFFWSSEQNGYNHFYRYSMNGKLINQITNGENEVSSFYGMNKEQTIIYYQKAVNRGLERKLYSIHTDGSFESCITPESGVHSGILSVAGNYLVISSSTISSPPHS
ncbi:MAG: DPP IV N-terminal domain-containing protein [Saprospiraceae bacterium]|nr:DPP IV N-terminal domain-containing protein [Saprospiraceae bacterium]